MELHLLVGPLLTPHHLLGLAALAAAGFAGWYCADWLYDFLQRREG